MNGDGDGDLNVLDLLTLPMGVGVDHAGCHVGGLSADVVERYAADERLPAEQRQAIRAWMQANRALGGKQVHCLQAEVEAQAEFLRGKRRN